MKIVELRAQNVKRLTAVEIKPDGSLVVIGGKNGAGKSSCLDSIIYALSGADSLPGRPVRKGEEKAEINITLEGGLTVRRRIHENGKTDLEIKQTDADGVTSKITSPQKLLDDLCGTIAFDPLAFTRLRPQEQVNMLRKVVGVEVADLDAEAKRVFDDRTLVNRDVKALESQAAAAPKFDDAPEAEVSASELLDGIEQVRKWNAVCDELDRQCETRERTHKAAEDAVIRQRQALDALRAQVEKAEVELERLHDERQTAGARVEEAHASAKAKERKDDELLRAQLNVAEDTNRKVRANKTRAKLVEQFKAAKDQSDDLTKQLDQLRDQRIARMQAAKWPVEGLGFSENGVTYQSLPFEQCSSAEQLRVATAIGVAQHPKLRVWMVRDGSLLDEDNLAAIGALAKEYDAQIWIERVGKGEECSVIIEDGAIVGREMAGGTPAPLGTADSLQAAVLQHSM